MSGEERVGQRRELFGLDVAHCDLCGVAVPSAELRMAESRSPLAEHDHPLMICQTCWERIRSGDLDVAFILFEEDEYGETARED